MAKKKKDVGVSDEPKLHVLDELKVVGTKTGKEVDIDQSAATGGTQTVGDVVDKTIDDVKDVVVEAVEVVEDVVDLERKLRQYVRVSGGFRKGLGELGKAKARDLLKRLGREEVECDQSILPIN